MEKQLEMLLGSNENAKSNWLLHHSRKRYSLRFEAGVFRG
jgi:hypothetical protein